MEVEVVFLADFEDGDSFWEVYKIGIDVIKEGGYALIQDVTGLVAGYFYCVAFKGVGLELGGDFVLCAGGAVGDDVDAAADGADGVDEYAEKFGVLGNRAVEVDGDFEQFFHSQALPSDERNVTTGAGDWQSDIAGFGVGGDEAEARNRGVKWVWWHERPSRGR